MGGGEICRYCLIYRKDLPLVRVHIDDWRCSMTTQNNPYPAVEYLIDTFGNWLNHRRELSDIRQMDRADFDRIAGDLRVSPGDLDQLVRRGPHAADELPKLLKALGIDKTLLAQTEPLLLRDMERVCSLCSQKRQCDRDLAAGTSAEHYAGYCLNASTIEGLGEPVTQPA
jgi:transcriptional regulator with XRE-family HTH domain